MSDSAALALPGARDGDGDSADAFAASLAAQWRQRDRFVILDDRFDGGLRFRQIRERWRHDPARCTQLHVITVSSDIALGCAADPLDSELAEIWPPITPNLHRLAFDGGRLQWLLVPMPLLPTLRELVVARVDAFAITGETADEPAARRLAKALARLAGRGTTVSFDAGSTPVSDTMRQALRSAGFAAVAASGRSPDPAEALGPRPDRWCYAPTFTPRQAPPRRGASSTSSAPVLIVGGGLAGCAMAWALAEQGRDCRLFERHGEPAMEASGNPAGLFHGIVNPQDGAHARFNRAAALEARRAVYMALSRHGVPGRAEGLLRLETSSVGEDTLRTMQATLNRLGLPPGYVQALSPSEASERSGLSLRQPAWWYPGGGWVQPGGLARSFLERAGQRAALRLGCAIDSLTRGPGGWQLRAASGEILDKSDVVVLANAGDALRLLRPWMPASQSDAWPLRPVRGQISIAAVGDVRGLVLPEIPITGAGYLLPEIDGQAIFGATSQLGDVDASVRASDHRHNLEQLSRLTGDTHLIDEAKLGGRTGWRWTTDDRLPLLGAVPDLAAALRADRIEQAAQVPRLPGLYACTALGSRGITWAALAAQVVAASITGAPVPLEAGLLDSVDAARFATRRSRRGR